MVSREKGSAAAFQAPPEMPFSALYGGYWLLIRELASTQPRMAGSEAGGIQVCSLLLFCCRTSAVAGAWRKGRSRMLPAPLLLPQSGDCGRLATEAGTLPQIPRCGSEKRRAGHPGGTRTIVGVKGRHRRQSPQITAGPNPRNRRCERSGRSPECRRPAFFSYTIKRRILFFHGKREWGF